MHFHQVRLLPDPERRAAHRVRHHTADHHVCGRHQPRLEGERGTQTGNFVY